MNMKNCLSILGLAVLYVVLVFACAFIGFLGPWCWVVVFPALAALLGAIPYFAAALRWQKFGVATLLSLTLGAFVYATGECDLIGASLMLLAGVLADVIRLLTGNDTKCGVSLAYPVLSLGVMAWNMKLWTDTAWYYQGAVDEMGQAYADSLMQLASLWVLVLTIVLTLVMGYVGIRVVSGKMKSNLK